MSQDLFAAFGAPEPERKANDIGHKPVLTESPSIGQDAMYRGNLVDGIDDDDDFGDFEDAPLPHRPQETVAIPSQTIPASSTPLFPPKAPGMKPSELQDSRIGKHPFAAHMDLLFSADDDDYDAGEDDLEDLSRNPEAAMAYSKRIINEQLEREARGQNRSDFASSRQTQQQQKPKVQVNPYQEHSRPAKDPNVLFDAEDLTDESEDDDFGDFEDATNNVNAAPIATKLNHGPLSLPGIDMLGLNDETVVPNNILPSKANDAETHPDPESDPSFAWPESNESNMDEESPESDKITSLIVSIESYLAKGDQDKEPAVSSPPTNVPPPIILLTVFLSIFTSARESLLDPLSKLDPKERHQLSAHPTTFRFLRSYMHNAIVLAHIIAGRKSRWKRDRHLAQSMRIGPAAAGGKGGMKLAGVDKSEIAKEDREVLDVLRLWKAQVNKLRGVVSSVSSSSSAEASKLPPVPEIADQMPVKTLKPVEGGFVAPHACALCGLKREERVAKVDVDINDSFGEWWLDNAGMHLVCHDFWVRYRSELRSR